MENIRLAAIECTENRSMSGIEELAANIAAVGLIQPIVLAELEAGHYRLLAGRRRFRALQQLGRMELAPTEYCLYPTKCDFNFDMVAFCENFHRANLTLAEEVEQFNRLKTDKLTIKELAALLGKTPEYVALRLNLTNLTGRWKEVLKHPEEYPQWTPAKLELIAKQPPEKQTEFSGRMNQALSVTELRRQLEQNYCRLSEALFCIDPCSKCLKRSGAADMLFPELAEQGDTCLDRKCFELKQARVIVDKVAELRKTLAADPDAEPFYLYRESFPSYGTEAYLMIEKIRGVSAGWGLREKKKGAPNAFCVWGENIGKLCRMEPEGYSDAEPINPKKADGTAAVDETGRKIRTLADREAELQGKRKRLAVENLCSDMERSNGTGYPPPETATILRLLAIYGYSREYRWSGMKLADSVKKLKREYRTEAALIETFWKDIQSTIRSKLQEDIGGTLNTVSSERAETFCELLGVDWNQTYLSKAVEAIPEPKSLLAARAAEAAEAAEAK